jgi:hypothetical protein
LVNMKCKVPTCTYDTVDDIDETSKVEAHRRLLGFHVDAIHPKPAHPRTEKIAYPKLEMKDGSSSEEQWNFFTFSWQQYKAIAHIDVHEKERLGVCPGDTVASMVFAS